MTPEQNLENLKKAFLSAIRGKDLYMANMWIDMVRGGERLLWHYDPQLAEAYRAELTAMSDARDYVLEHENDYQIAAQPDSANGPTGYRRSLGDCSIPGAIPDLPTDQPDSESNGSVDHLLRRISRDPGSE